MHIIQCAEIGADVMTGPLSAITTLLNHPLTDIGLAKFLADFKKSKWLDYYAYQCCCKRSRFKSYPKNH